MSNYPLLDPLVLPTAPPESEASQVSEQEPPPELPLRRLQTIFPEYDGGSKEANIKGYGRRVLAAAILLLVTAVALPVSVHYGYKNWYGLAISLVLALLQILCGIVGLVGCRYVSVRWTKVFKQSFSIYLVVLVLFLVAYEAAGMYLTVHHNTNNCSDFSHYTVCDQRWGFMYTQLLLIVYLSALNLFLLMLNVSVRRACDKFIHIVETPYYSSTGIS